MFNQHCMDNNYKRPRFNIDFYTGPFSQFKIKVKKCNKQFYAGKPITCTFFMGVDIKDDDVEESSEEDKL